MKQIEIARMGALSVKVTQSLINGRSRIIYLVNFLNLTSGQPWTYVQVVRQQNELGIPKRTTVSVEPWHKTQQTVVRHLRDDVYTTLACHPACFISEVTESHKPIWWCTVYMINHIIYLWPALPMKYNLGSQRDVLYDRMLAVHKIAKG